MAWRFALHCLSRLDPTVRRRRGMELFRASFFPEGLLPQTAAARRLLPRAERCLVCHLCLAAPIEPPLLTARDLALRVARSCHDWVWAAPALASDHAYAQAEALCPVQIPFRELAALVRAALPVAQAPPEPR